MNICFFTRGTWEGNGGVIRPREFGRALLGLGHSASYLVDDGTFNRTGLAVDPRSTVHYIPNPNSPSSVRVRRRVLKELKPEFVHVVNPSVKPFLALVGMPGQRIIGDFDEWPKYGKGLFLQARNRLLERWMLRRSCILTVASRQIQRELQRIWDLEALYLPNATFLEEHPESTSPFTEPTAVYMNNMYPERDDDVVFHAAQLLQSEGCCPKLVVIGTGADLPRWQAFVREHGLDNVRLVGWLDGVNLWRHLRYAHVLVFPLRPTPLNLARCPGKAFCYAQARRPVITTRVGEIPEVLGEKATYVECTPRAFADSIRQCMAHPALPDVDYQVEHQNWTARARLLVEAAEKVLNRKTTGRRPIAGGSDE